MSRCTRFTQASPSKHSKQYKSGILVSPSDTALTNRGERAPRFLQSDIPASRAENINIMKHIPITLFNLIGIWLLLSTHIAFADSKPVAPQSPEVTTTLRAMLQDYRRYTETHWHADAAHTNEGYWGTGRAENGNEGVRATSTTALVYALLARDGDATFATADRVAPALRYAADIHVTGSHPSTDGKRWGRSWQSAMWAGNLGVAAWLAKDTLAPDVLASVERVVTDEADRFIGQAPPTMEPGDTKAEENAWDLTAPAAALLLMPGNPHAAQWQEAVLRYGFNTLSVEPDKASQAPADGKKIADWVTTTQLFPDFTLENHGIFHPVYSMIGPATNGQAAVAYRLGGKPVPDALTFNVLRQWAMLQYIALPDGEWLYPQGLDWDLHDYEHLHYWTMLATLFHDPTAALLEQRLVAYARRRQQINGDGSFVGPSGSLGFAREAVQAERVAFALLMHQQFGPSPTASAADWNRMTQRLAPVRVFPYVGMVIQHTQGGLVSFSWKNRLMAQIVPQSVSHLDQPYLTTPTPETLVGGFTLEGEKAAAAHQFHVNHQAIQMLADGFAATVDADINAGSLRQQIALVSVAPGMVGYIDRVTAQKPVTILEERGLLLGIENDDVSGSRRQIQSASGGMTIPGGEGRDHSLLGHWVNVDGRLGLISLPDSALLYRAAGKANRAGAREDYLMGCWHGKPRHFAAGDVVACRVGIVLLNASSGETAKFAAQAATENTARAATLRFTAPDGRRHVLALTPTGTASWDGHSVR